MVFKQVLPLSATGVDFFHCKIQTQNHQTTIASLQQIESKITKGKKTQKINYT
jgi:hypothetical protein